LYKAGDEPMSRVGVIMASWENHERIRHLHGTNIEQSTINGIFMRKSSINDINGGVKTSKPWLITRGQSIIIVFPSLYIPARNPGLVLIFHFGGP